MPAREQVRAVIFDWGGTLTPWHTVDLAVQWRDFAQALSGAGGGGGPGGSDGLVGSEAAAELAGAIMRAETSAWQRAREEHRSARLEDVLVEAGVDLAHADLPAARAAYEQFWEPHTHTDPLVGPLWEELRRAGLSVGVLSNTIWTRDYHRSLFGRDGVLDLIDGDVYSSEIPWAKPHPEAFRAAAEAVGAAPQECVYVGDRLFEDVHGPQQVGMRAIWIPHSQIPVEQQVQVQATPDAVIQSLAEVSGVVLGWGAASGDQLT